MDKTIWVLILLVYLFRNYPLTSNADIEIGYICNSDDFSKTEITKSNVIIFYSKHNNNHTREYLREEISPIKQSLISMGINRIYIVDTVLNTDTIMPYYMDKDILILPENNITTVLNYMLINTINKIHDLKLSRVTFIRLANKNVNFNKKMLLVKELTDIYPEFKNYGNVKKYYNNLNFIKSLYEDEFSYKLRRSEIAANISIYITILILFLLLSIYMFFTFIQNDIYLICRIYLYAKLLVFLIVLANIFMALFMPIYYGLSAGIITLILILGYVSIVDTQFDNIDMALFV